MWFPTKPELLPVSYGADCSEKKPYNGADFSGLSSGARMGHTAIEVTSVELGRTFCLGCTCHYEYRVEPSSMGGFEVIRTYKEPTAAVVVLFDVKAFKVLMLKRGPADRTFPGAWCFPGGKREPGESIKETAVRELFEETGLPHSQNYSKGRRFYHLPGVGDLDEWTCSAVQPSIAVFRVSYYPCGPLQIKLSDEHIEYRWVTPGEAIAELSVGVATREILWRIGNRIPL